MVSLLAGPTGERRAGKGVRGRHPGDQPGVPSEVGVVPGFVVSSNLTALSL